MFLIHTYFSFAQVTCFSCHPQIHSYITVISVKEPVLDAALPDRGSRSGPLLLVDSSLPSVLPVLHALPLANATTDFSLSLTFFVCKASVAVTTSLGGCENYTDSLMWYQPRWAPSRWQPSWGHRESDTAEHAAALRGLVLFLANTNMTLCSNPLIPQGVGLDLIRCCTLHILGSG